MKKEYRKYINYLISQIDVDNEHFSNIIDELNKMSDEFFEFSYGEYFYIDDITENLEIELEKHLILYKDFNRFQREEKIKKIL